MQPLADPSPRASGLYGIVQRGGRPLDPRDCGSLGLGRDPKGSAWAVDGHDPFMPGAVSRHDARGSTTVLVGHIEDADELAQQLGLDPAAPPARLAQAALERSGADLPCMMVGEWSLFHRAADGEVTLMVSAGVRDPIFYALAGERLAFAPDLFALARLDWVDRATDPAGLMFPMARAALRAARADTTMLRGVRELHSGDSVTIDPDGRLTARHADVLTQQPPSALTFDELVEASEHLLRRIMSARLARTRCAAHMLSGGLDSSLLAWLASEEHSSGHAPIAVTSAAPPGSGLPDETAFAAIVAETIGMACHPAWPDAETNIYRPAPAILAGQNGPPFSTRHGLTDALVKTAMAHGASMMIDGCYGEMSVTAKFPDNGLKSRTRAALRRIYRSVCSADHVGRFSGPFHVRLAPHRLAALPEVMQEALSAPATPVTFPGPDEPFGYHPGVERGLALPTEFYPGAVRLELPFRDLRLLRLFARVPVRAVLAGGADRPVVRRMMQGHLPDSIRLRRRGMPASPDHDRRLKNQASAARARIALFRKAGIDDWLDLDWLDLALADMAVTGPGTIAHGNEVQLTAMTAEFLLWWFEGARTGA